MRDNGYIKGDKEVKGFTNTLVKANCKQSSQRTLQAKQSAIQTYQPPSPNSCPSTLFYNCPRGRRESTPFKGLYRYVQSQRVWFFCHFGHKIGY